MTQKRRKAPRVERGTCSRRPTQREATEALVTLASFLSESGASSIELYEFATGATVRVSVTYGSVNSLAPVFPITTS